MSLDKNYNPKDHEDEIYNAWQQAEIGRPEKQLEIQKLDLESETHCILMPPPNLTGKLHAGHAFQHYLMDTLSRINRQQGKLNLWYPGVDHAGLQLEGVVNKLIVKGEFTDLLKAEVPSLQKTESGLVDTRKNQEIAAEDLALYLKKQYPETWLKCAWQKVNLWRNNQKEQSKILGDTPDYSRELFTLDDRASSAVSQAFIQYFQDGLIYKGAYLVNWSVGLQTALSDVSGEVDYETRVDPFVTFEYRAGSIILQAEDQNSDLKSRLNKYFVENPILVSTVRPETIFGDVAAMVNENVLKKQLLTQAQFTEEEFAIIAELINKQELGFEFQIHGLLEDNLTHNVTLLIGNDQEVDPNFGTGALKITPASDQHDYDIFQAKLGGSFPHPVGRNGKLTSVCGQFDGLTVEQGRLAVIKTLLQNRYIPVKPEFAAEASQIKAEAAENLANASFDSTDFSYEEGLKRLQEILDSTAEKLQIDWNYSHNVSICERTKTVIEPLISDEFFLSFHHTAKSTGKSLQQHGLESVQEIQFFSDDYASRATNFLENIKNWCISRDIIWGHKMPVWYNLETNPDKKFYSFIQIQTDPEISKQFQISPTQPQIAGTWVQEEKVLDTWFSSGLWPLSTLGFFESKSAANSELSQLNKLGEKSVFDLFYPTGEMLTGKEIFYVWVVRMLTLGHYFTGQAPFKKVIIHPTILDDLGRKMSKSLGNGLEPSQAIEKVSSDALRLAMLSGMYPNRNYRMGDKIAAQLMEKYRNFGNKVWNVARFLEMQLQENTTVSGSNPSATPTPATDWILAKFKHLETELTRHKNTYELAKCVDELYVFLWDYFADWYVEYLKTDPSQLGFAQEIFRAYVQLLSPFAPFECEVLWRDYFQNSQLLAEAIYKSPEILATSQALNEFQIVVETVQKIRSLRGLFRLDPAKLMAISTSSKILTNYSKYLQLVCKIQLTENLNSSQNFSFKVENELVSLSLKDYVEDIPLEINRTQKQIQSLEKQIQSLEIQLANPQFISKAEPETIAQKQADLAARKSELIEQNEKSNYLST